MSDPITTVVTVISEHPQAAATVASIYGVAKPFLAKLLGPGAEEIGEAGRDYIKGRRAKNTERTLTDADKLLTAVGREPQQVPLSIVVPLLEAASIQDEATLAGLWAALLANAADSGKQVQVHPSFVSILRDLTSVDAIVLTKLAAHSNTLEVADAERVESFVDMYHLKQELAEEVTQTEFGISVDNLLRLRLCWGMGVRADFYSGLPVHEFLQPGLSVAAPGRNRLAITELGIAFLTAVTPPTS